jgi:hypothetical protein
LKLASGKKEFIIFMYNKPTVMHTKRNATQLNGRFNKTITLFITAINFIGLSCGTPAPYIISESRQRENKYYRVSTPNTQLLTKKNEIGFSWNQDVSENVGELSAGYMMSDHVGVVASYVTGDPGHGEIKKFEFGLGYSAPLSSRWQFETYAGTGFGHYDNDHATGHSLLKFGSYFIQPTIVRSIKNDNCQLAFSSRLNRVHFQVKEKTFDPQRESLTPTLIEPFENKTHFFYEPAIALRVGWKEFLFNLQLAKGIQLSKGDIDTGPAAGTIGVALRFNLKKKTKPA